MAAMSIRQGAVRFAGVTALVGGLLLTTTACQQAPSSSIQGGEEAPASGSGVSSMQIIDRVTGAGSEAGPGATVRVHYTGWLYDATAGDRRGQKFDSSKDRGEPFAFRLGAGEVITGWDEGVSGMKVGGTRILTIPPDKAYGARGAGGVIPPNATLVFEIELLEVMR